MNREFHPERMNAERIFARGFVVLGGIFWTVAAFAGPYVFGGKTALGAFFGQAVYPLLFTIAVLAIGWYYERFVSLLLGVAVLGTIAWGVIMAWEPVVWAVMLILFLGPTVTASVLYYLAAREEEAGQHTDTPHAETDRRIGVTPAIHY